MATLNAKASATAAHVRPSGRVTIGMIGCGRSGILAIKALLAEPDCHIMAVCDVDDAHLHNARHIVNARYGNADCKPFTDYRELLGRNDIDAVVIAVPNHWHAIIATEAAKQRKDIYGEVPLAHTIAEQRAILKAVQQHGTIWQSGTTLRSDAVYRRAVEIVRSGLIGIVSRVEIELPSGYRDFSGTAPLAANTENQWPEKIGDPSRIVPGTKEWDALVTDPPHGFDYQRWIGPAQMEPFIPLRVHGNWRWNYNTGGGRLLEGTAQMGDVANWGLGFDLIEPSEVEARGEMPPENAVWNTPSAFRVECRYPRGVTGYAADVIITMTAARPDIRNRVRWVGSEGWVSVGSDGLEASNPNWLGSHSLPEQLRKVQIYRSDNHWRNFLDSIKTRRPPISPAEIAHRATVPGHLGVIAMTLRKKIAWDSTTEEIEGNPYACELLSRPYRAPWTLDWSTKFATPRCSTQENAPAHS